MSFIVSRLRRTGAGFSLIELVLVLALTVFLGAVTLPLSSYWKIFSARLTQKSVFLVTHLAKSTAMSVSQDVYFSISPTEIVSNYHGVSIDNVPTISTFQPFSSNNKNGLGFKSSGIAKYSGTLTMGAPNPMNVLAISRMRIGLK